MKGFQICPHIKTTCIVVGAALLESLGRVVSDSGNPMDCSPSGSSVHGISRQEGQGRLPFPSPEDLPDSGIEPRSPAFAGRFFLPLSHQGSPHFHSKIVNVYSAKLKYIRLYTMG